MLDGVDLLVLKTHERARRGIFLAHQEPPAIAGVSVANVLRSASDALRTQPYTTAEFFDKLRTSLASLHLAPDFANRNLHEAMSGGEKKRVELLSLLVLEPKYAILDELDSGMDAEARALAITVIQQLREQGVGFLVISHNSDVVESLSPTRIISL